MNNERDLVWKHSRLIQESLNSKKLQWLKGCCPICGKEYDYREDYKPVTCGKFDCLQKAHQRGYVKKVERKELWH